MEIKMVEEKLSKLNDLIEPILNQVGIKFKIRYGKNEDGYVKEEIKLYHDNVREHYILNIRGNSINASLMELSQFIRNYLRNSNDFYNGTLNYDVQGMWFVEGKE